TTKVTLRAASVGIFPDPSSWTINALTPSVPSLSTDVFAFAPASVTVGSGGCALRGQVTLTNIKTGPGGQVGSILSVTPADFGSLLPTFCSGDYVGTLSTASGKLLAHRTFTVP